MAQAHDEAAPGAARKDVIVITGCSRGIGLEFVTQYARSRPDADIFACYRRSGHSEALEAVAAKNRHVTLVEMDVGDAASIAKACDEIKDRVSHVSLLINNAAVVAPNHPESALGSTGDVMMNLYRTNTVGPYLIIQHLFPYLLASSAADGSPKAKVISLSSDFGSVTLELEQKISGAIAYRCTKAALNMMNAVLAMECPGVTFVVMNPGWVKTDMGSQKAGLAVEDSVASMLRVISAYTHSDTGKFYNYDGSSLPW